MAIVNIERPISYNSSTNRYEKSILVKDANGNIIRDTQIFETATSAVISSVITNNVIESSHIVENLTLSIETSKITYSLSNEFFENSLSVYLNGVNITNDIESKSSNTFTLIDEYKDVIRNELGETLIAVYAKKQWKQCKYFTNFL